MIHSFMGFTLDTDRIELRDGDSPVHLEPQVFDLLVMLIEHRDRVVTKRELLEEVWGDTFVSESALTSRVKSARQALGDSGRAQRVIRTVHGRGYQFIAEVTERTGEEEARPSTDQVGEVTDSPTGTVTFLFSDIERSSAMWEQHPEQMALAIPRHDELLRSAIEIHRGTVFATGGDGVAAAFGRAADAVGAAEQIRRTLDAERWPTPVSIRVRLGLHTGEALERNGDYLGAAVNRAARVAAAANGGQTLLSDVTSELLADRDDLVDLGICLVDPAMPPMRLWQLGSAAFLPLAGAVAVAPPLLRTELIGRDAELERVADLTAQGRLVSITAPAVRARRRWHSLRRTRNWRRSRRESPLSNWRRWVTPRVSPKRLRRPPGSRVLQRWTRKAWPSTWRADRCCSCSTTASTCSMSAVTSWTWCSTGARRPTCS
ncbi:MAG: winged helix-turn-helix domain-containing protein [Microthrixaceae bacterium]